jgi:hypothetical protein
MKIVKFDECTFVDCPPGLFIFKGRLGLKSEYFTNKKSDAYCVSSGEFFWGGVDKYEDRDKLRVVPIEIPEPLG